MSAAIPQQRANELAPSRAAGGRTSLPRVISSEWLKLISVRTNLITILAACVVVIGAGILAAAVSSGDFAPQNTSTASPGERIQSAQIDPTALSMAGVQLSVLVLGSVGVLAMTGEYASGLMRTTLTAVPKRLPVLWAKSLVIAGSSLVVMAVSVFVAFFAAQEILNGNGNAASLSDAGVLRAVIGNIGYLVGVALLGVGLGELLRSTASAITTLFAALLVIPGLVILILPDNWADAIYPYLPSIAAQAFTSVDPTTTFAFGGGASELLSPRSGAIVFVIWVGAVIIAAAVSLKNRDV